jgi:L-methionine (R)-S-oxide reductase
MSPDTHHRQLAGRYDRIYSQLEELYLKTDDSIARMATAAAVLHHKMPHYFWTGFYLLRDGKLVVGPYQGPLACAVLPGPGGVCQACVTEGKSLLVPDVEAFPGHVACDSRSQSELVVPVHNRSGAVAGVCDVDSDQLNAFSEVDLQGLERIVALIQVPVS